MGNSSSHPANTQNRRPHPPPPSSTTRSRPLKSKKRSIVDHPVLLPATTPSQSPSSPIAIPTQPGQPPPLRPPPPANIDSFSAEQVTELLSRPQRDENHTHRPLQYNSTHSFGGVSRGGVQGGGWTLDYREPRSGGPRPAFKPELVRSSIPLRITPGGRKARSKSFAKVDLNNESTDLVRTPIVWRGGGKEVVVAGTFDPLEWRAREPMRFDPQTSTHVLVVDLPPGTYLLKFIVDDAWRCSDDMPTATDDDTGNLVNYVDVEDPNADPGPPSSGEERHGREFRVMKANRRRTYHTTAQLSPSGATVRTSRLPYDPPYHPPLLPPSDSSLWDDLDTDTELEVNVPGWERGRDGVLEKWTNVVPEPLTAAAHQEESYLVAVQAQREVRRGGAGTRGTLGSLGQGVPNIPPAPRLPRHLDRVILNTRQSRSHSSGSGSHSGRSSRSGKHRSSRLAMTNLLPPDAPPVAGPSTPKAKGTNSMEHWALADDSSVLPVPSHVVLHHLGTSAIKNGVLAVSDTTRYNKKYITTIYYKPG